MAPPIEHHGTGWTDCPWCWQESSSEWWVMGLVETAGRAQCYPAPEEWDSWKSPCPATPQTEPCWLSSEATWRHGERPADSWGTGRCHGNRGSSRVTQGRAEDWTTELLGKWLAWKSENESPNRKPWCWAPPRCGWKITCMLSKTFPCINNCKKKKKTSP